MNCSVWHGANDPGYKIYLYISQIAFNLSSDNLTEIASHTKNLQCFEDTKRLFYGLGHREESTEEIKDGSGFVAEQSRQGIIIATYRYRQRNRSHWIIRDLNRFLLCHIFTCSGIRAIFVGGGRRDIVRRGAEREDKTCKLFPANNFFPRRQTEEACKEVEENNFEGIIR